MAKHCEVCHQPYADKHDSCPHCAAAANQGGASPPQAASDSGIVIVGADAGSAPNVTALEGSSMDIDLSSGRRPGDSGIAIPASDAGPASDLIDLDWSAVAESSAKHPPLVDEPLSVEANLDPNPAQSGEESSTVNVATLLAASPGESGSESELVEEIEEKAEEVREARAVETSSSENEEVVSVTHSAPGEDDSSAVFAQDSLAETSDSSMVDLGSQAGYRDRDDQDRRDLDSAADISLPAAAEQADMPLAAQVEAADSARARPAPSRRAIRGWVGGGVVGLFMGAAAFVALWAFGIEPPQSLRALVGKDKPATAGSAPTFPRPRQGSHRIAKDSDVFWFYLADVHRNHAMPGPDDPTVAKYRELAANMSGTDGAFQRGLIDELCGNIRAAREAYAHGLEESQSLADRRRFQAALDRIDTRSDLSARPKGVGRLAPGGQGTTATASGIFDPLRAALVGLLLPAAPAIMYEEDRPDEPGFYFWAALRQAREQHYDQALTKLAQARKTYDKGRFVHHGQGQNPNSDPTEEIFLRCCDELHQYWLVREKLTGAGYLDAAKQPSVSEAIEKLLKSRSSGSLDSLAHELRGDPAIRASDPELKHIEQDIRLALDAKRKATAELSEARKALHGDTGAPGDSRPLAVAVAEALRQGRAAEKQLAAVTKALHLPTHDSVSSAVTRLIMDGQAAHDRLARAQTRAEKSEAVLHAALERMTAAGLLPPGSGPDKLLAGMDRLRNTGSTPVATAFAEAATSFAELGREAAERAGRLVNLSGRLAAARVETVRLRLMLAQGRPPQEMLAIWAQVLERSTGQAAAQQATRDADRVLQLPDASAAARAEALYVHGLALQNAGKFEEARQAYRQAVKTGSAAAWSAEARRKLAELTDVQASYLPRIRAARQAGELERASRILQHAMQVFAGGQSEARGILLAERSLVRLEQAQSRAPGGRLTAADVAAAAADAKAASALGAKVSAAFAQGQIAAARGDWPTARAAFETAYRSPAASEAERNQYRLALAQALLRLSEPRGLPASYLSSAENHATDSMAAARARLDSSSVRVQALAALLVLAVDGTPPIGNRSALEEAASLADEAVRSGDPHGHLIRAQVLARQDQWTASLQEYLRGMEQISRPRALTRTLHRLVNEHPAFRMPDSLRTPQPDRAEKHYSAGLDSYWSGDYPAAARQFTAAIHDNGDDARYRYFLGLAWLHQDRRADALEAFRQAGLLEKEQLPDSGSVNTALERIQGSARELLDGYRK